MAATKGDYESMGERAARTNTGSLKLAEVRPTTLRPGSWQCRHWDIGFERADRQRRHQSVPLPVGEPTGPLYHDSRSGIIHSHGPYWRADVSHLRQVDVPLLYSYGNGIVAPIAAREHLKLLGAAHNEEHDLRRRARLHRSIGRVLRRWGRRYAPNPHEPAVPMKRLADAA